MTTFTDSIRPEDVGELLDLTVAGDPATTSMADLQLRGIAALYNTLCLQPLAYLADEVGMGKTYQALGLAAVLWNEKPDARILFISPRENLQVKWFDDYKRFFASNYRRAQGLGDDRAASVLFGEPIHRPVLCNNLRSWTPLLGTPEPVAAFLRHTSFSRPVYTTSRDYADLGALWEDVRDRLHSWSLFEVHKPKRLTAENASAALNRAFSRALNAKLTAEAHPDQPYFDLVVVDEAQCLRRPDNQTNSVLHRALEGQAGKWLFMSATPAHGGPSDVHTVLNHYPGAGELIPEDAASDLRGLQRHLQRFMVRRSRTYKTGSSEVRVKKDQYRRHERDAWSVRDEDMTTLQTLAMGLVQKGLVDVLQGRSNRFRVGFLSSFESLQSSLQRTAGPGRAADEEEPGDWHHGQSDGATEPQAPDTAFIEDIASDFETRFEQPLPHPKIESVVDRIAPLAFGSDEAAGGEKFLVFTRRVSTVETLRRRLTARYIQAIEARARRCWGRKIDWDGGGVALEAVDESNDPEAFDEDAQGDPFRAAMSNKGWLFRYRQTFRDSGRNVLFFEDGWLLRLCQAGGVDPAAAAQRLSETLWAESWTHASRSAGAKRQQQHRAARLRYLAVQAILREPEVFGLDEQRAAPWRDAYEVALHHHLERANPASEPHVDLGLFDEASLWVRWDARMAPLSLPAADPNVVTGEPGREALLQRHVVRTLLAQVFRLTDTIVDLFFADELARERKSGFADAFLDWATSDDPAAKLLRADARDWLTHLRLIVDSSLDGAGRPWRELARKESWDQLYKLSAVLGVTGGSGAHRTATRQFRTPSLPRVIVCTDTLKEGVDLHLFCDRVLHYGVAWTSGDLEQRVGRVDRFFSQIERRLSAAATNEVTLEVGYPHVVASIEKTQVDRVIERQKRAELLMDSPLGGTLDEERELGIDSGPQRASGPELGPFGAPTFPSEGRRLVAVSSAQAQASADHYARWYGRLVRALQDAGWTVKPADQRPVREATLVGPNTQHELSWGFDAALRRYTLTISDPPWEREGTFSGGKRLRTIDKTKREQTFARLLIPTPEVGDDPESIERLLELLRGAEPRICTDARTRWSAAAEEVSDGEVEWLGEHKASARVLRGERAHKITMYAYEGGVRVVGIVSALDNLASRPEWGDEPTKDGVRGWALGKTNELALGYLDVHERDGLLFGVHVLHGELSMDARSQLLREVAWRADQWEATLTGEDAW